MLQIFLYIRTYLCIYAFLCLSYFNPVWIPQISVALFFSALTPEKRAALSPKKRGKKKDEWDSDLSDSEYIKKKSSKRKPFESSDEEDEFSAKKKKVVKPK